MFTDVPANIGISIINVSLYTVEASFFDALGQAFTSFLIGSVLLSGNMSQLEFAGPSSFIVDYINPFAEVFWSVSDSLEDISALAQQIANGTTTFLRTTRTAPPDVTLPPLCSSQRSLCVYGGHGSHFRWGSLSLQRVIPRSYVTCLFAELANQPNQVQFL